MQVDVWLSRRMLSEIEYRGSTYHSENIDLTRYGQQYKGENGHTSLHHIKSLSRS